MAGICDTCHAGCCRTYNLFITAYDALVISQDLGLPIAEFVTFLARSKEGAQKFVSYCTPLIFSDPSLDDKRFFLVLRRVESILVPGTNKCYFLQEWNRQEPVRERGDHPGARIAGRCGIYGSRPLMCRTFPTTLHGDGAVGFISTPTPTDQERVNDIYKVCPEKWSAKAFATDPSEVMHTLVLRQYEVDFQNRAIAEWNAHPGPVANFFPFMLAAYGNRFRLTPDMVARVPDVVAQENPAPIPE